MKTVTALLLLCLFAASGNAAERRRVTTYKKHSTLPAKSKMIVIPALPPVPTVRDPSTTPSGLIATELSGRDVLFFTSAVESGQQQIFLGELVSTRGEEPQIKAIGTALASTQRDENREITKLASLKGLKISDAPPAGRPALETELGALSGSNFDKACMDKIIVASQQSLSAYETASQSADGDIKAFSEQMLPIAREKLRLAQKMTGAGAKAASALFRTGAPPVPPPVKKAP